MEHFTFSLASLLFLVGAVVGVILKDWTPAFVSAGLFFMASNIGTF